MNDDQTTHQSADDALESDSDQDGMFRPAQDEDKLSDDYDTPATPADDVPGKPLPQRVMYDPTNKKSTTKAPPTPR